MDKNPKKQNDIDDNLDNFFNVDDKDIDDLIKQAESDLKSDEAQGKKETKKKKKKSKKNKEKEQSNEDKEMEEFRKWKAQKEKGLAGLHGCFLQEAHRAGGEGSGDRGGDCCHAGRNGTQRVPGPLSGPFL